MRIDFDINNVPTNEIKDGTYNAIITSTSERTTAKGDMMLVIEYTICEGEYRNRKVWENLNLWASSEVAQSIARQMLLQLAKAAGLTTLQNSEDLHGKTVAISTRFDGTFTRIRRHDPPKSISSSYGSIPTNNGITNNTMNSPNVPWS